MQDYRLMALKNALQSAIENPHSTLSIKECGGMAPGILDEGAAAKQKEYLQLLETLFAKMEEDQLDEDETKSTLLALIMVFNEETEELSELCDMVEGFEDVKTSWSRQNETICGSLERALTFYQTRDARILESALGEIRDAMNERLPLYAEMVEAEAIVDEDCEDDFQDYE